MLKHSSAFTSPIATDEFLVAYDVYEGKMLKSPYSSWGVWACLKAMILFGSLFLISSPYASADVQRGVEKYRAGEYEEAIAEWLVDAGRDDPYALFFLGQDYRLGLSLIHI